jgi:hypothetical protein
VALGSGITANVGEQPDSGFQEDGQELIDRPGTVADCEDGLQLYAPDG